MVQPSGLFLLDLSSLVASLEACELGMKKHQCWLDKRTHQQLRDSCGAIAVACKTVEGPVSWGALTERHLEKRFGRVRSMFPNSKMSASDYWRSSAINMRKEVTKFDHKEHPQIPDSGPVSAAEFEEAVVRAFDAAMRLLSICSGRLEDDLRSVYAMSQSCPNLRAQAMNEDNSDDEEQPLEPPEVSAEDVVKHVRESQALATSMHSHPDQLPDHECDDARASLLHERAHGHRGEPKIAAAVHEVCNMRDGSDTVLHPQDWLTGCDQFLSWFPSLVD